jgi:cysteinyl-tRNA synthetase
MNITDIDDKIIRRAVETGVDIRAYTAPYMEAFFEDCRALSIERPDVITRATDYIPEMIALVERLMASGHAYREGDSIYFRITQFPGYGRLSRLDRRELKVGARIDADEYDKEQPNDFVLWKAPKDEREPRWSAPFGEGRPGWHLECSAMAMKHLGATLDIHCGGVDNIFPHHENEIAQSEAATGQPFARFWIHGEHLLVEGEKMAKSKGNFYTLRDLLAQGKNPQAIRYLLLSTQYRKQLNFTMDGLAQASNALGRIAEFVFRLKQSDLPAGSSAATEATARAAEAFEAGLDDDLNTPRALGALFELIRETNSALDQGTLKAGDRERILEWLEVVDDRLAIVPRATSAAAISDADTAEIERLIAERQAARRNRDFAASDRIRQQLSDRGVIVEDTRDGMRWKRK